VFDASSRNRENAMKIFLNYSPSDREYATKLGAELSKAGLRVFDPFADIAVGDNWSLESGKALEGANAMVVLLSPESAKSEAVRRDIGYALGSPNFQGRLVSVVIKPTRDIPWILEKVSVVLEGKDPVKVSSRIVHEFQSTKEK